MNILSFDTSSPRLSLAVLKNGEAPVESVFEDFTKHSEAFFVHIRHFLEARGLRPEKIDKIVVGTGPGSFTGLRVGVTAAKTLAYALGKEAVGIPSADAVAEGAPGTGPTAVLMDARRGLCFFAFYEKKKNSIKNLEAPRLAKFEEIVKKKRHPAAWVGDAVPLYEGKIRAAGGRPVGDPQFFYPRARALAELARRGFGRADVLGLEPLYLYSRDCNVTPSPVWPAKGRPIASRSLQTGDGVTLPGKRK